MTKLSVNLNKVALLRNARAIDIPNVVDAARTCVEAGAHGITVHPRPDQRHTRPSDVYQLSELLADFPAVEFNVEGNPFPEFVELVRKVVPTQCTLVPDSPDALTSDHGWELAREGARLRPIIRELKDLGVRVSLFMDTDAAQIERAGDVGADRIELYTEPYAAAYGNGQAETVFYRYARAAEKAQQIGMGVNAGHDLNLKNLGKFCSIPNILEVSIGHALIADALEMGLSNAVRAYLRVLNREGQSRMTHEVIWSMLKDAPVKERFKGVRIRPLWEEGSGAKALVLEIDPGCRWEGLDVHDPGPEEVFVVSGVFNDGVRDYPAGTFIHNPAGSSHVPQSEAGCTLFVFYPEG